MYRAYIKRPRRNRMRKAISFGDYRPATMQASATSSISIQGLPGCLWHPRKSRRCGRHSTASFHAGIFLIKGSEDRSALYSWLHRIVVSKCYEFLRKKRLTVSCETSWEHSYGTARMRMPLDPYPTASSGRICGGSGAREWTGSTASRASWGRRTAITVANIPEPSFRIRPTVWS